MDGIECTNRSLWGRLKPFADRACIFSAFVMLIPPVPSNNGKTSVISVVFVISAILFVAGRLRHFKTCKILTALSWLLFEVALLFLFGFVLRARILH